MNTNSRPPGRFTSSLSPSTVALSLCITFACPFSPSDAASDDDSEIEEEGDPELAIVESAESQSQEDKDDQNNQYTDGLVWIVETEVVRLDLPTEDLENTSVSTGSSYRDNSIELSAQWFGSLTNVSMGFVDVSLFHERIRGPLLPSTSDTFVELNEIWIENRLHGLDSSIRVGLQNFEDNRGWWWNEEVVSAQWLGHAHSGWDYSAALLKSTSDYNNRDEPADPEEQGIYYLLLQGQVSLGDHSALSFYGLHSVDRSGTPAIGTLIPTGFEDESDTTLTHLGLGVEHEVDIGALGMLNLRGDIAILNGDDQRVIFDGEEDADEDIEDAEDEDSTGNELEADLATEQKVLQVTGLTQSNISAWAADFGINWEPPLSLNPVIELGLAFGSGTSDGRTEGSNTFRQTGLHDNSQDRGTYGNVLIPDLSNLQVLTLAASIPLAETGDISLYHHRFRKMRASGKITENELDLEGESNFSDIGNETGLYLQFGVLDDVEVQLSFSQFRYGNAVTNTTTGKANRLFMEISYEF